MSFYLIPISYFFRKSSDYFDHLKTSDQNDHKLPKHNATFKGNQFSSNTKFGFSRITYFRLNKDNSFSITLNVVVNINSTNLIKAIKYNRNTFQK